MVDQKDVNSTKEFIQTGNFPSRLRLILYIVNREENSDCVNRYRRGSIVCRKESVYPLNRLRNIAITHIKTTHFIVFDMDMWPASIPSKDFSIGHLYRTLHNLPESYLNSPYAVTIIPAFSLPSSILRSKDCVDLPSCIHLLAISHSVTCRAAKVFPETKKKLVACMKEQKCSIFRPESKTHVLESKPFQIRTIFPRHGLRYRIRHMLPK